MVHLRGRLNSDSPGASRIDRHYLVLLPVRRLRRLRRAQLAGRRWAAIVPALASAPVAQGALQRRRLEWRVAHVLHRRLAKGNKLRRLRADVETADVSTWARCSIEGYFTKEFADSEG